jgi:hypothetical protein
MAGIFTARGVKVKFKVQSSKFKVQSSKFKVQSSKFKDQRPKTKDQRRWENPPHCRNPLLELSTLNL